MIGKAPTMKDRYKPHVGEVIEAKVCGEDKWMPATFRGWHRKTFPLIAWHDSGHVEIKASWWDIRPGAKL